MIPQKDVDELIQCLQAGTWVIEDWTSNQSFSPLRSWDDLRIVPAGQVSKKYPALLAEPKLGQEWKAKQEQERQLAEEKKVSGNPYETTKWLKGAPNIIDRGEGEEPIIGFRDFLVVDTIANGMHLMSRNQDLWAHRRKNIASCGANSPLGNDGRLKVPHDAPHHDCDCGIYAYDTPDHMNLKQAEGIVWAEIALWGDVYICETGYRGEFSYPLSLFIKDNGLKRERRVAAELERNYGVPVYLVEERDGKTASDIMGEMIADMLSGGPGMDYESPGYLDAKTDD